MSRYVSAVDENSPEEESIPFKWGCDLRRSHRYGAVILDFGQISHTTVGEETVYGARIFDGETTFYSVEDIMVAVERFLLGYSNYDSPGSEGTPDCVDAAERQLPYLYLIVGVNNYGSGEQDPAFVDDAHGEAWADMINAIADWIYTEAHIGEIVEVSGGIDAELDYNTPANTLDWADGYEASAQWRYYDFGDASACPQSGTTSTAAICDNPNNGNDPDADWYQDDVWAMSFGHTPAYPFPEIYLNDGDNARQWEQVAVWGYENDLGPIPFIGVLTTWHTCDDGYDPTKCFPELVYPYTNTNGIDNEPGEGFTQLRDELDSGPWDPIYLGWSSDFTFDWLYPPSQY